MSLQITFTKSMLEGLSKSTLIEIICSLQKAESAKVQTQPIARRVISKSNSRAHWTPIEDEALLNDLARGYTVAAHAKRCKRSYKSVAMRLRRLQDAGKTQLGIQP